MKKRKSRKKKFEIFNDHESVALAIGPDEDLKLDCDGVEVALAEIKPDEIASRQPE